jgi:hypothetical protein
MIKQRIILLSLLFLNIFNLQAQEREAVKATIDSFFSCLHRGDSVQMEEIMTSTASMRTLTAKGIQNTPLETFLMAIARPRPNKWEEKLWSYQINIDGDMATAWTDYTFYLDSVQSHCGVNQFLLIKSPEKGWQIQDVIDTRRKEGCLEESREDVAKKKIDKLMDEWHLAAAEADADAFYGKMTEDGIYIGTDISERWLRDELRSWAKSAFDKAPAWDFKAKDRTIYLDPNDPTIAWLEESLDTWMGPCRGSAVLKETAEGWRIKHYHLAVAVPNDAIDQYLKILGLKRPKKK